MASLFLSQFAVDYPKKSVFCIGQLPDGGGGGTNIVEPMNSGMCYDHMGDYYDLFVYWQNEALYRVLGKKLEMLDPGLGEIDRLLAVAFSDFFSGVRYKNGLGSVGCKSMSEIATNLVPSPVCGREVSWGLAPILDCEDALFEECEFGKLVGEANSKDSSFVSKKRCGDGVSSNGARELSAIYSFRGRNSDGCIKSVEDVAKGYTHSVFGMRKVSCVGTPRKMEEGRAFMGEVDVSLLVTSASNAWIDVYGGVLDKRAKLHRKRAFEHHYYGTGITDGELNADTWSFENKKKYFEEMDKLPCDLDNENDSGD